MFHARRFTHWSLLSILLLVAAIASSPVSLTVQAQGPKLTDVVSSRNGKLSIRVPAGWYSAETSTASLPTAIVVGNSQNAVKTVVAWLEGTSLSPLSNKAIVIAAGIVSPSDFRNQNGRKLTVQSLIEVAKDRFGNAGAQLSTETWEFEVGGGNGIGFGYTYNDLNITAFDAGINFGGTIVEIAAGGAIQNFQPNTTLIGNILLSVRSPAEQ